jgi:putative protease
MPIEAFIHGGMCSSYSGRCTLSNSMANRDANKGGCAHSCRWTYKLMKDNKVIGDTNFIIASCDLMSIEYIPSLLKANVDSFKIEGRMKSVHYIATVVNAYRRIIDEYYKTGELTNDRIAYYKKEIKKAENRITYTGFLNSKMKNEALLLNTGVENPTQAFIALVVKEKDVDGYSLIEVRNHFEDGCKAECFMPSGETINITMKNLYDLDGNKVDVARHPKQILKVKFKQDLPLNTFIRKR